MARIKVNNLCNVLTGEDSNAYRSAGNPIRPEITIPQYRARLSVEEAWALVKSLTEAIGVAENDGSAEPTFRLGQVSIYDSGVPAVGAYISSETWNGWAKPYFTREQADVLVATMTAAAGGDAGTRYDAEQDAYIVDPVDDVGETYPGEDVEVNGQKLRLYGIGAGNWIWWDEARGE